MGEELKARPFCGGEARHYAPGPPDNHVECVRCHADVGGFGTEADAVSAWNTRETERRLKQVISADKDEYDTMRWEYEKKVADLEAEREAFRELASALMGLECEFRRIVSKFEGMVR